jgi:hypothetical protein
MPAKQPVTIDDCDGWAQAFHFFGIILVVVWFLVVTSTTIYAIWKFNQPEPSPRVEQPTCGSMSGCVTLPYEQYLHLINSANSKEKK